MKAPISWIKEYTPLAVDMNRLIEKLTMAGTEVSSVEIIGRDWNSIYVAELITVKPHPGAQRLSLATISLGDESETVVCGAPNLKVGDKVAFARVGAMLIDGHSGKKTNLKVAKIRGVESKGMICSEKELGISDSHEGILVLPQEAPVGTLLVDFMGDAIFNLEVTPNRPDLLSITGIAREIAALTGVKANIPKGEYEENGNSIIDNEIKISVEDEDLCPRYSTTLVKGVKIGQSPQWMQRRLTACGMRPINNIVDITNYVMLEFGQPLHAFDYDLVQKKEIIVQRAQDGEKFTTLDGVKRVLDNNMLIIADGKGTVALAGVMGGLNSEVNDKTINVLLESANFDHACIHYTARKLGLSSEASLRFEKGLNPDLTLPALKRATQLLLKHTGGEAIQGIFDDYLEDKTRKNIPFDLNEINKLIGFTEKAEDFVKELKLLGFDCPPELMGDMDDDEYDYFQGAHGEKACYMKAPYWRSDIRIAEDILEEIARIRGYDSIPQTMLPSSLPTQPTNPMIDLKRHLRSSLVGFGFQEIISYTLTNLNKLGKAKVKAGKSKINPMQLVNPMSADQEYLRTSMRADLLEALVSNRKHEDDAIQLFEIGRIFLPNPNGGKPLEPEMLYGLITGPSAGEKWPGGVEQPDFYSVKGVIEALLDDMGIIADYAQDEDEGLQPNCQARVLIGSKKVGVLGKLHPKVKQSFGIEEEVYLIGLSLNALLAHLPDYKTYNKISAYPAVERDIAVIIDENISHHQVMNVIKGFPLVTRIELFDVYTGKQVPAGKKSMAYRLFFQSQQKTLTDIKAGQIQTQILKKLEDELGATLRA